MPNRGQMQRLLHREHAEEHRRRINRSMVTPGRDPDSGEPIPDAPNRYAAMAQASAQTRSLLMLPAPPPARPLDPALAQRVREITAPSWARALDLCLMGVSKKETARILDCTYQRVDLALRKAYKALGVRDIIGAGAAWRARTGETYRMNESDERAARALLPPQEDGEPLTPREDEALSLLAAGVARRDLPIALGISSGGVHKLLQHAYRHLRAHDQRSAVQAYLARHRGECDFPPYSRYGGDEVEPSKEPLA